MTRSRLPRLARPLLLGALLAFATASAAPLTACVPRVGPRAGPSAVGTGQLYQSGDPTYDEFFTQLHELQVELGQVPAEETELREPVIALLEAEEDESTPRLAASLGKALVDLNGRGTRFTLLRDDKEGKVTVEVTGTPPEGDDEKLVKVSEKFARALAKLAKRGARYEEQVEELEARITELRAGVERAFGQSKARQAEVEKNLEDAGQLIPLMRKRVEEVRAAADGGLERLQEALAELPAAPADGATPEPPAPPAPPPKPPGPPAASATPPAPPPAPPATGKPPPKPPAPKPPAPPPVAPPPKPPAKPPGGDFEP